MNIKKFLVGFSASAILLASTAIPALAAKPVDTCHYVVDGNIPYAPGHNLFGQSLMPGYDVFGYNYQAHIFNGSFANAYLGRPGSGFAPYTGDDASYLLANPGADSHWAWPFRNVNLQMKWNDAWLANSDCGTQVNQANYTDLIIPDGLLDRHYPTGTYIGSGAWLTNHATGTYEGSNWEINGNYVLSFNYLGTPYVHDMTVTTTSGTFSGTGAYPSGGPYVITWTITGTISGSSISFHIAYDGSSYYVDAVGTIAGDGTMSGTWNNASQSGTWTATSGVAVHPTCTVSDFVKIIAPPADAQLTGDTWYTADGEVIGKEIWGDFAIIQEMSSDPCDEYGVINYLSPLKKGLGGW